jgi:hypothetical protein
MPPDIGTDILDLPGHAQQATTMKIAELDCALLESYNKKADVVALMTVVAARR